ncbi:MAG: F0F1 ATP synthase subunit gamma [Buchnera aphidicola (Eriosoma harunire)]
MTSIKIIKNKINSAKNTKKITKTMEMVAISKTKKAKIKMLASRPYIENIQKIIQHLLSANLEYQHIYFQKKTIKTIGFIIISTDRGLCGNLNNNLYKKVLLHIQKYLNQNINIKLIILGDKGIQFFKNLNYDIVNHLNDIENQLNSIRLIQYIRVVLEEYINGKIDKLYIAYNQYNNTLSHTPCCNLFLPIIFTNENYVHKTIKWDYIYEPNPKILLDTLLNRFLESKIYQSVLENLASEQAARMIAMKTASDNSNNIIKQLQLIYNKARQAAITQELNEIVAGSHAITCN